MVTLLAGVAAYTVLFTLLVATAEHLSRPGALARAVTAHRVLPAPGTVAVLVVAAEGVLAGTGIVALHDGDDRALRVAFLLGSAALLGAYAGYGQHLVSTGRGGPCGCSRLEMPMTGPVVARAAVLAGLALVGLAWSDSIVGWERVDSSLAVVLLAAATFATLLWHLPSAMHQPVADQTVRRSTGVTEGGLSG